MRDRWKLWFDGACEPSNPGPMAVGALLMSPDGQCFEISERIGFGTNNVAEYRALIRGLEEALARGAFHIDVRGDSQLVIRHLTGEYRVKAHDMRLEFSKVMALLRHFHTWNAFWVPRDDNARADALSKRHLQSTITPLVLEAAKMVVVEKQGGNIWAARRGAERIYAVDLLAMQCSCPRFTRRRQTCEHLLSAKNAQTMQTERAQFGVGPQEAVIGRKTSSADGQLPAT